MGLNKRLIDQAGGAAGLVGTDNFAPVLYTGNGGTQSISSLDFQPDLVWIKQRSGTGRNVLTDSVRGAEKILYSELSGGETIYAGRGLTSFDSSGFTVDDTGAINYSVNHSGTYVAWCWKAGGAAVSNTDGSITSSVSANQDAGFSIVKYTGTGNPSNTVGHGLSQAPEFIIQKRIDGTSNWYVITNVIDGSDDYLFLNTTAAKGDTSFPTTSSTMIEWQASGEEWVYYCFHSVDGYQKIGSYSGSGSSLNTISVGFAPRFVLFKRTDSTGSWRMFDSTRGTDKSITANTNGAEYDDTQNYVDFTSDGFEFNRTVTQENADLNHPSGTYIYLAIA